MLGIVLPSIVPAQLTREDSQTRERNEHEYGKPNGSAPEELCQFDFLGGSDAVRRKLKREDGTWKISKRRGKDATFWTGMRLRTNTE
jgi:hypothetical protein